MFRPCHDQYHIFPSVTSIPNRALTFSRLSPRADVFVLITFLDHIWVMFWPCPPSFTSKPARALKCSRLSHHGLRQMSIECPIFKTMCRPCFDHAGTMFGLALIQDQLELWHFQIIKGLLAACEFRYLAYMHEVPNFWSYVSSYLETKTSWTESISKLY